MSGGLDQKIAGESVSVGAVVERPVVSEPGTEFRYNTGESELVALAMDRMTSRGMCLYVHKRLLVPLGVDVATSLSDCDSGPAEPSHSQVKATNLIVASEVTASVIRADTGS